MSLPDPLTTPDIDVRDFDGFMLNTERLLASELWALSTGEEFKAAMGLWCRAWKQIPAGSLPDDARILASFAGITVKRWEKVKDIALRGFVACSDGRLYHRVLCADVLRAYGKKLERRTQTKAATEARLRRNEERNVVVTKNVTTSQGQGQRLDRDKEREREGNALARALVGLFLSDSPKSVFQWETLVKVEAEEQGSIEDQVACVEWCVETARAEGVTVKYAEHALKQAHQWRKQNRKRALTEIAP